jgi:uracil-DNA glycosylase
MAERAKPHVLESAPLRQSPGELALVKPKLVVTLGATALHALSAHKGPLGPVRKATIKTREGAMMRCCACRTRPTKRLSSSASSPI